MTWIVTGASGRLGGYILEAASGLYTLFTGYIELKDHTRVRHNIDFIKPSVFIHCAAMTEVDLCEKDPAAAKEINTDAVENIVRCLPPTTKLVYISSDMVYPDTPGPHPEWDTGKQLNVYALTKRLGEMAALKHPNTLVLRTNFFGRSYSGKKTFSDRILEGNTDAAYYDDILFSPLHLRTLAELVVELVERNAIGIFNAGSRGGLNKHQFAQAVAGKPLPSGKSSFVVKRPHDMRMDVSRLERLIGRPMPTTSHEIGLLLQ